MSAAHVGRPVPTVDPRASRVAQGVTALLTLIPLVTRTWPLLALPIAHLASALFVGQRGNVGLVAFRRLLAARLGPAEPEDARPPRFANLVGLLFLAGAVVAHRAGFTWLGWALGGIVFLLATL